MALQHTQTRGGPALPADAPDAAGIRRHHRRAGREVRAKRAAQMVQCGIAMRRVGPRAWLKVTGEPTTMTSRHLDDYLAWLINEGVRQITVLLATAHDSDQASLRVLHAAQSELHQRGGDLFATAARAATRRKLTRLLRASGAQRSEPA